MTALFRLLAFLPLGLLHACGTAVGWLAFLGSPTYRRRFMGNARLAGLAWPQVRAAVAASGRLLAELPRLWFGRPVPVRWEGEQAVADALARGRGVIVLTPHLGCFEIIAQGYAARFGPITVLYRRARKAWLTELVDKARLRPNLAAAPTTMGGVRQMLKALRAGQAVGLLPDQVPPQGLGVWAPFFGRDAYTMTLTARLVQQTGATVVLHWGERLGAGRGYCIHAVAAPPLQSTDPAAAAAEVNRWMEGLIGRCPGQYLWGYARYKQPRQDSPS